MFHRRLGPDLEVPFRIVQSEDALAGTLADVPFTSLLEAIAVSGRTGVLRIGDGSEIFFSDGKIYLAKNSSSPAVESVLFGAGVATADEIDDLMANRAGQVVDELAGRSPEAGDVLDRLLHEYNLTALFELIVPSDHSFEFENDTSHPIGPRYAEPVAELVTQAQRRLEIWKEIAARIPATNVVFKLAGELPGATEERLVTSDEWRYLALLDGRRTVADVITTTGESAFRVCSLFYRLLLEEVIVEK